MRTIAILLALLIGVSCVASFTASHALAEGDDAAESPQEEPAEPEQPESLDDLLKRIEASHKDHTDFSGNFEQRRYLPLFDDTITSSGRFVFKKPDHVRWEYSTPHRSILVVKGETGRKWSAATGRVERFRLADDRGLDAVVNQLFTWFRGEFTKLKDDYDVTLKSRDPLTLEMKPKNEALRRHIATIEVVLGDKHDIRSVKLIEPLHPGDDQPGFTLYTFSDARLNTDVKDSEFEIRE